MKRRFGILLNNSKVMDINDIGADNGSSGYQ
jgi:hypothetical protein